MRYEKVFGTDDVADASKLNTFIVFETAILYRPQAHYKVEDDFNFDRLIFLLPPPKY